MVGLELSMQRENLLKFDQLTLNSLKKRFMQPVIVSVSWYSNFGSERLFLNSFSNLTICDSCLEGGKYFNYKKK